MFSRFMAFIAAVIFFLGCAASLKAADTSFDCPSTDNYQQPHKFGPYTAQLLPGHKPQGKQRFEFRCLGTITPPGGVRKLIAKDWTLTIDPISGTDVNGDGKPDLIFDGHTSGARCCYEYWIAGLSKLPRLEKQIRSELPISFEKTENGVLISIPEAAFQYFLLPAEQSVTPNVILKLEGSTLKDVSAQNQSEYDDLIAKAKAQLAPADLEKFHNSRYNDKLFSDQLPTVRLVLTIVLNYLYSGREAQAWQAFQEMWPPTDQSRAKSIILERRGRGVLSELGLPAQR
ncbi:MAG TPA: hypothetical protein VND65_15635 [Candidatus Binatia bacterium]|nr:hypothetical protein [Candidatus Binatia bacterium]